MVYVIETDMYILFSQDIRGNHANPPDKKLYQVAIYHKYYVMGNIIESNMYIPFKNNMLSRIKNYQVPL